MNGNYSKELTLKMIEVGLGPYIGLPKDPNATEFKNILSRCQELDLKLEPTAKLAALLQSPEVGVFEQWLLIRLSHWSTVTYRALVG